MNPIAIAAIVFVAVFGGALGGMALRSRLPPSHLGDDTREIVRLGMGLIATMSALVLGLVTASAKSAFDQQDTALKHNAAEVLMLDRTLARYGPETGEVRAELKRIGAYRLGLLWPEEENIAGPARLDAPDLTPSAERMLKIISDLKPTDDGQRALQARALDIAGKIMEARWMMLGSAGSSIQAPFLVIVVFWLSMIFASFGLFAPHNATVVTVLFICALSVATSLFLIVEMDDPFHGMMKISSAPIRFALSQLGQ